MGPTSNDYCAYRKRVREPGHTETQGRRREDGGKDWNDVFTTQGMLMPGRDQKLGNRHGMDSLPEPPEGPALLTPDFSLLVHRTV